MKLQLMRLALQILLDQDDYDILLAEVPQTQERVLQMTLALGFKQVGVIPGLEYHYENEEAVDVHLLYINEENLK